MPERDPRDIVVSQSSGPLYFIVGLLIVAVLAGAYVLMGTPGLHDQVAHSPAAQRAEMAAPVSATR